MSDTGLLALGLSCGTGHHLSPVIMILEAAYRSCPRWDITIPYILRNASQVILNLICLIRAADLSPISHFSPPQTTTLSLLNFSP